MSSTHAYFAFYCHVGLLNQWKGVKIVCFQAGTFVSKKTNCRACVLQQEVFLTLVSDVFLNLSFDLPVLPPLFAYLNKLDRSPSITLWYSFVLILKHQVVFVFICLKISTFCLQILIRCRQKQTVWHWRARHQPKVYTISNYNQTLTWSFDSEAAPWKYCICVVLVFVVLYCYSFSIFRFKTYFLPM